MAEENPEAIHYDCTKLTAVEVLVAEGGNDVEQPLPMTTSGNWNLDAFMSIVTIFKSYTMSIVLK